MAVERPESETQQAIAVSAALAALRPIVALLLDAGINTNEVTKIVRWVFVDEAASRQRWQGKKPSISRIAAATGLSRSEVSSLISDPAPTKGDFDLAPRASDQVIAAWTSEPDFLEPTGKPKPLPYSDGNTSFSELVRRYAPDIPPRAMLNEMIASRLVHEVPTRMYLPITSTRQPLSPHREAIAAFGAKLNALGSTLINNLRSGERQRLFEAFVHVNDFSNAQLPKVTRELSRRCKTFTQGVERYLLDQSPSAVELGSDSNDRILGVIIAVVERTSSGQI